MLNVNICAVGRLRQSPEAVLVSDYISRFNKLGRQLGLGPARIVEVEDKTNSGISAEATLLEKSIPKNSVVCILDENGLFLVIFGKKFKELFIFCTIFSIMLLIFNGYFHNA